MCVPEDPGPGKSQKRYERWCKKWVEPKFTFPDMLMRGSKIWISVEDCFQLRCSLIHSGSAEIDPKQKTILDKFEFFDQNIGSHLTWYEGNRVNGVLQPNWLQLKADLFSKELFDAADERDNAMAADKAVQREKAKLLVIHSKGITIGGIHFG